MRTSANPFRVPTHRQPIRILGIAVVGAGYWGTNPGRNLHPSPDWDVVAISDLDMNRASKMPATPGDIPVVESLDKLHATVEAGAVAIASPAPTHYRSALTALRAGTGSASGLRVLSVLEAVTRSLSLDGQASAVAGSEVADSELRAERAL